MTLYVCSPECDDLVKHCTKDQATELNRLTRWHDHVIACHIVHPGRKPTE